MVTKLLLIVLLAFQCSADVTVQNGNVMLNAHTFTQLGIQGTIITACSTNEKTTGFTFLVRYRSLTFEQPVASPVNRSIPAGWAFCSTAFITAPIEFVRSITANEMQVTSQTDWSFDR